MHPAFCHFYRIFGISKYLVSMMVAIDINKIKFFGIIPKEMVGKHFVLDNI